MGDQSTKPRDTQAKSKPNLLVVVSIWLALGPAIAAADHAPTAIYSDPRFGISFQYPRTYQLLTGEDAKLDWGYLGPVEMNFIGPDGMTIAAVRLPDDSYPGTDFSLGFFRVNVDLRLDASACDLFARTQPDLPTFPASTSKIKVGANEFVEGEDGGAASMKQADSRNYHIFRNNVCYDFELGLGTAGFGAVDGLRQVDHDEVFRKLEAILATVKIDHVNIAGAVVPPTSIRSLDVAPVTMAKPMTYRVIWNALAVPLKSLRLTIGCNSNELKVWQSTGGDKETALECGNPIPLPSNNGSLLLRFKSSAWVHPQIALVAQANLLETRTIQLPPSPSIEEVFAGDCEKETGAPLIPGYPFTIGGGGFTAKDNAVKLGSERLGVSQSEDGQLVEVTLPQSVAPGRYELFVENHLGSSDAFPVVVVAPPPPQNITSVPIRFR